MLSSPRTAPWEHSNSWEGNNIRCSGRHRASQASLGDSTPSQAERMATQVSASQATQASQVLSQDQSHQAFQADSSIQADSDVSLESASQNNSISSQAGNTIGRAFQCFPGWQPYSPRQIAKSPRQALPRQAIPWSGAQPGSGPPRLLRLTTLSLRQIAWSPPHMPALPRQLAVLVPRKQGLPPLQYQ